MEEIDKTWFPPSRRASIPRISLEEARSSFNEVYGGISEEEAIREAKERCFHCGSCTQCDFCLISCPEGAIRKEGGVYRVDEAKCTLCRLCAEVCPRGAIQMPQLEGCVDCGYCRRFFECPALIQGEGRVEVDEGICVQCGLCLYVCPQGAIKEKV